MRNILFLIFYTGYVMATDLNNLWASIEKNSLDYASSNVDLEKGQINNLKAYSAALSGASISPSDDTVQISLNFSPATFFALDAANKTLQESKHSINHTQSLLMRNAIYDYLSIVSLVKQKKSLSFELDNNKKYLEKAQAEHSEGLLSKASLGLWNTRYNQSKINLINLEAKIADAQNKLATQMGVNIKTISTFSNRNMPQVKSIFSVGPPHYVKASKSKRQSAAAAEDASYLNAIIPELTLSLSNQNFGPNKVTPSFSFSINLSPVFDGMTASQDLRSARLDMLKAQRENNFNIQQIKQKISLFNEKIKAAKSSYLSAIDRYKANRAELELGKITETTFSNSIVDVSKQRKVLIESKTDLLKNYVALLHEYGQINSTNIKELNKLLVNIEAVT